MKKLIRFFEHVFSMIGYFSGLILLVTGLLILIEVFTRYGLRHPFTISDEYSGYGMVAIAYMGLAYTFNKGGHIRITFVVQALPRKVSNWLRVITLTIAFVWVGLASVISIGYVKDSFERGMKSITPLLTPLGWPRLALPIGFSFLGIALIIEIFKTVRDIRSGVSIESEVKEVLDE